ncbi:MAG: peptidase [Planctomycetaceae bacterium]|nr:peptidase [Planctomycetaceae bacterium]
MTNPDRLAVAALLLSGLLLTQTAHAVDVYLKDGRILNGKIAEISGLAERYTNPMLSAGAVRPILLVDDDLRRTFVSQRLLQAIPTANATETIEKFAVWQHVRQSGLAIASMGPIVRITPFSEYGRRILTINTPKGQVNLIQGITELTPTYAKLEGLVSEQSKFVSDMRIATNSIPPDTLDKILRGQVDENSPEERKRIASFYVQAEMYEAATKELEAIAEQFGDAVREQLEPTVRLLKQMSSRRLLKELELRRDAGQHTFVFAKLKTFPTEGVAGEILQQVSDMIAKFDNEIARRDLILKTIDGLTAKVEIEADRQKIGVVRNELQNHLNFNTLDRMTAFLQFANDESMLPQERLALAVSGWLVGSDLSIRNLPVALSMLEIRGLVRQYLTAPDALSRSQVLEQIRAQEAGSPRYVARLVRQMLPLLDLPEAAPDKPGYYALSVDGPGGMPIPYWVQVPPEYDPLRRYPVIVTLNGAGTTPEQQIDWWAGAWQEGGWRAGQASRYGYIVVAPQWTSEHQKSYDFSDREHGAVLYALRDAYRRFSIDTDRVFLTGHSMGGDAVWDIGLAHPDLWAGVIPVVATSDRYDTFYWENAELLPFYVVSGELDGDKMVKNARDLDRYLTRGYPVTVVEYRGRGHEHFSDEILRLFDWMGRYKRNFFPKEFKAKSMRPWDNFFWWVELADFPARNMVLPSDWPPASGRVVETTARATDANAIFVTSGAGRVTVWLSPEMLNFDEQVNLTINGKRVTTAASADPGGQSDSDRRNRPSRLRYVEPDLEILLEDVRTRGDRLHPFWAKVEG